MRSTEVGGAARQLCSCGTRPDQQLQQHGALPVPLALLQLHLRRAHPPHHLHLHRRAALLTRSPRRAVRELAPRGRLHEARGDKLQELALRHAARGADARERL